MLWTVTPYDEAYLNKVWREAYPRNVQVPILDPDFVLPMLRHMRHKAHFPLWLCVGSDAQGASVVLVLEPLSRFNWQVWFPVFAPLGVTTGIERLNEAERLAMLRCLPGFALQLGLTLSDPYLVPRLDSEYQQSLDNMPIAWVELPNQFAVYWQQRGKNLKQNINKAHNRLQRDDVAVQFRVLREMEDMAAGVRAFSIIEQHSWKAEGGTEVAPGNALEQFYQDVLLSFAARGQAQIWQLKLGDDIAAVDLCIETDGVLVILKTTYDTRFASVSPAQLLRYYAFRHLCENTPIRRVEFYGRMMEWHTKLTVHMRRLYHLNVYRWKWLKRLHSGLRGKSL